MHSPKPERTVASAAHQLAPPRPIWPVVNTARRVVHPGRDRCPARCTARRGTHAPGPYGRWPTPPDESCIQAGIDVRQDAPPVEGLTAPGRQGGLPTPPDESCIQSGIDVRQDAPPVEGRMPQAGREGCQHRPTINRRAEMLSSAEADIPTRCGPSSSARALVSLAGLPSGQPALAGLSYLARRFIVGRRRPTSRVTWIDVRPVALPVEGRTLLDGTNGRQDRPTSGVAWRGPVPVGGYVPYWRLHYHLIWATKHREPLLAPVASADVHGYLRGKAIAIGCVVHAVGGIEDHVHMVVSIPPRLSVASVMQQLKGGSAHHLRHSAPQPIPEFAWQDGYGALSMSGKHLAATVAYVESQVEHHGGSTLQPMLEASTEEDDGPLAPPRSGPPG
jgi:putative transposase